MKTLIRKLDSLTHNDTAATKLINDNFEAIQQGIEDALSRSGKTPNFMDAPLDMNTRKIINLGTPENNNDAATKKYVDDTIVNVNELTQQVAELAQDLDNKQDTLVSGENIKTINSISLLGEGNIDIQGGGDSGIIVLESVVATFSGTATGTVALNEYIDVTKKYFPIVTFNSDTSINLLEDVTFNGLTSNKRLQIKWKEERAQGEQYSIDRAVLIPITTDSNRIAGLSNGQIRDPSNLVTSVSSASTDLQYPSAKLFYDTCGDIETLINAL